MKKFTFPLTRMLSWRQTQTRLEEAALAKLQADLSALALRRSAVEQSVEDARAAFLSAPPTSAPEIGALEHYRAAAAAQTRSLQQSRLALERKVAQQMQKVITRRRDARLLQQLHDRRLHSWKAATDREIEQQAGESYLARYHSNAVE